MLDVEATKAKEIGIQAELYRILNNHAVVESAIVDEFVVGMTPDEALIEASIVDSSGKKMKADLVLMAKREEYRKEVIQPVLVIETKTRRLSNLTRPYNSALKQVRQYAHTIGCPTYSVYDGHTLILMQITSPFLIGLYQWTPSRRDRDRSNREFARKLWITSMKLKMSRAERPVNDFIYHPDFEPWKRSIYYFIRDAFQFQIEVVQEMSTQGFNIEEEARRLADKYRSWVQ